VLQVNAKPASASAVLVENLARYIQTAIVGFIVIILTNRLICLSVKDRERLMNHVVTLTNAEISSTVGMVLWRN
jgi:hypothetical protein